ncbi:MAG: response regulator [Gemmatimonadota bacterium]|nr:response regulator [Gemmatimonadota bacterium]
MSGARVLVVDDDENICRVVRRMLTAAGYEVEVAGNGQEALTKLSPEVAVVISDVLMPEMDGIEMLRRLRKEAPDAKIISMSGGGIQDKEHVLEIAERLGAARTLSKPFTREELLNVVAAVLRTN